MTTISLQTLQKVMVYLGQAISSALPKLHGIIESDTISYLSQQNQRFEETSASRTILYFLDRFGGNINLTEDTVERIRRFIRTMLYDGKKNESYIDTE